MLTKLIKFIGAIGMLAVLFLMCIMTVDVILRYAFNRPLLSAFVITEYLMVIFTYSAIAYAELREDHVSVTILFDRLAPVTKSIINILNRFVMLVVSVLIARESLTSTIDAIESNTAAMGPISIPQAPAEASILIGCSALCLLLIAKISGYGKELYNLKSNA